MREVVSLEQQRFLSGLGKGISKTVPEIQLGRVATALAEVAVRLARNACLTFSNRLDRHLCFPEQVIESAARDRVAAAIDDGRRFDIIDRGNAPMDGFLDCLRKHGRFSFIAKYGDDCRCVENDCGSPFSS